MKSAFGVAVLCAGIACLATSAEGQERRDTSVIPLDTLQVPVTRTTVSAARAPVSLSRVGRGAIQDARPTIGLDESLRGVPGLIIDNRQNFSLGSRVVIRGLGARAAFGVRGVRVIVDGIPLTMPDGQTNLNNLDLGSAGTIHVLRGPASALFGNAAGGVIAVETEPAPGPLSTEAGVTLGNQGRSSLTRLWKAQAKVGGTSGGVDYLASVSRMQADGYRDHGRARQTLVNARAGMHIGPSTRVSLVLNAVDVPVAENPGSLPIDSARATPSMAWARNVETGAGESTRQAQAGLRLQHARDDTRADASVYVLARTLENPLPFAVIDLERTAGGVRGLYERRLRAVTVTGGVDAEAQRDYRMEFANEGGSPAGEPRRDQEDRVASIGPFAQIRHDIGRAGIMLGLRYDAVRFETIDRRTDVDESGERTLHAPSFMAGASLQLRGTTLFANVASAFQTPTTTELLNAPPAPGQPCCPTGFNTNLEPQRLVSAELGARGSAGSRWSYEAAAYLMNVTDALVQFQVPEAESRDFFRNAGRTRHRGVELAAGARLTDHLSLHGAYTLTDVRFRDDGSDGSQHEGNRVPGIAPHRVFASATWTRGGTLVGAEVHHTARQPADDANSAWNQAYTVVDLRARTAVVMNGLDVAPFVALNNIFNQQYFGSLTVNASADRFYEPAPGFSVSIGARVRTGAWTGR